MPSDLSSNLDFGNHCVPSSNLNSCVKPCKGIVISSLAVSSKGKSLRLTEVYVQVMLLESEHCFVIVSNLAQPLFSSSLQR